MKSSTSVSSRSLVPCSRNPDHGSASEDCAVKTSRSRLAVSSRKKSVMRRVATWMSQPRGLSGIPSAGHCTLAAANASCTASSAAAKSLKRRTVEPRTCGASSRNRFSVLSNGGIALHCQRFYPTGRRLTGVQQILSLSAKHFRLSCGPCFFLTLYVQETFCLYFSAGRALCGELIDARV
jgi:hypothetical protein